MFNDELIDEEKLPKAEKCFDKVSTAILTHTLYPEFFLVQNNIKAKEIFVELGHFFVSDSAAQACGGNQKSKRPTKLSKNRHTKNFKKMEKYYPGLKEYKVKEVDVEVDEEEK